MLNLIQHLLWVFGILKYLACRQAGIQDDTVTSAILYQMINKIPNFVLDVYKEIEQKGFEVYFVGGCVRNLLINKDVKDWDLTTKATPEEILKIFPNGFYDNKFGTVGVPVILGSEVTPESDSGQSQNDKKHIVEITTYRTEHGYDDKRHPTKVEWGKTIEEDLQRRDFTVNAIALRLTSFAQGKPLNFELFDPFGGQKDIKQKILRAVGDPKLRFKEDALRLMRAIRFAATHSFQIEEHTWKALVEDTKLIQEISKERVQGELLKILATDFPQDGVMLLKNSGLLEQIIPELLEGVGVSQVRPGRHHTTDVFTHNVMALKLCPSVDPIVRFATLLHDVGKPRVASNDEQGYVIFHNHEIIGARMTYDICERLKFSKRDREKIVTLIRWHMFTVDEHTTDASVRRFIRKVGVENIKDMIDLRIGDRLGSGTQTAESWRLKLFKQRVEKELQPAPFSINDLAIDGNDIMKELNIPPGPKVGELLQKLFEEVDEDLSKNTKEFLLKRLHDLHPSS